MRNRSIHRRDTTTCRTTLANHRNRPARSRQTASPRAGSPNPSVDHTSRSSSTAARTIRPTVDHTMPCGAHTIRPSADHTSLPAGCCSRTSSRRCRNRTWDSRPEPRPRGSPSRWRTRRTPQSRKAIDVSWQTLQWLTSFYESRGREVDISVTDILVTRVGPPGWHQEARSASDGKAGGGRLGGGERLPRARAWGFLTGKRRFTVRERTIPQEARSASDGYTAFTPTDFAALPAVVPSGRDSTPPPAPP